MANKTGLLCSVDDLPPEAGHPNDQAKQLHFNDPHLEHKLFPHLFLLAHGLYRDTKE